MGSNRVFSGLQKLRFDPNFLLKADRSPPFKRRVRFRRSVGPGISQEAEVENYIPAECVEAYRQLMALNLQSYKPEVEEWLHSEEAEAVLAELLLYVPCPAIVH